MPFVRISLRKEIPSDTNNKISEAIHQALMEDFNIPVNDYFHVIERLEQEQIHYPPEYLGISHTENIVFIQITAGAGRTCEQKKSLYKNIAQRISSSTNIALNDIIIILTENNGMENWSFGLGEIQKPAHLKIK